MTVLTRLPSRRGTAAVTAVAPPRVAERLAGRPRPATVLHRGAAALYLDVDGWCLGVVRATAVAVPCALTADVGVADVRSAAVGDGVLVLDDAVTLRVARFRDVRVPRIRTAPHPDVVAVLRRHARPAEEELGPVTDPAAHVGRGSGLTPLGDDVLAGWLATSYVVGAAATTTYDVRGRTSLLSATLVDCAARGEVLPEFRDVVTAWHDPAATDAAAARLAQVGHTSGAGLLLGAAVALS